MMLDPRPGLVGGPVARGDDGSQSQHLQSDQPYEPPHRNEFYHRSVVDSGNRSDHDQAPGRPIRMSQKNAITAVVYRDFRVMASGSHSHGNMTPPSQDPTILLVDDNTVVR